MTSAPPSTPPPSPHDDRAVTFPPHLRPRPPPPLPTPTPGHPKIHSRPPPTSTPHRPPSPPHHAPATPFPRSSVGHLQTPPSWCEWGAAPLWLTGQPSHAASLARQATPSRAAATARVAPPEEQPRLGDAAPVARPSLRSRARMGAPRAHGQAAAGVRPRRRLGGGAPRGCGHGDVPGKLGRSRWSLREGEEEEEEKEGDDKCGQMT